MVNVYLKVPWCCICSFLKLHCLRVIVQVMRRCVLVEISCVYVLSWLSVSVVCVCIHYRVVHYVVDFCSMLSVVIWHSRQSYVTDPYGNYFLGCVGLV